MLAASPRSLVVISACKVLTATPQNNAVRYKNTESEEDKKCDLETDKLKDKKKNRE
jgi:hypothetical protein